MKINIYFQTSELYWGVEKTFHFEGIEMIPDVDDGRFNEPDINIEVKKNLKGCL